MSDIANTTVDGVKGYPSLTALRDAHAALLEQRRAGDGGAALLARAEQFIQRGVATGALLDSSDDRRAAQSLLNYWANILYRAERGQTDATLAEFDPILAPALPDELCPYLGLDAFSELNAEQFFGRSELIGRMIERLREQRLIAVVGPSGSGKSSVVRAGLLPALKGGALPGSESWRYLPVMVPGSEPMVGLERILRTENREPRTENRESRSDQPVLSSPVVLVVDQFEEVFTLCEEVQARAAFVGRLLELARAEGPQHRVILTMRSDFETFVARIPELQTMFERGRVQVTPLSAAEMREAIEEPAAQVGLRFEQGVVEQLLQDILGEPAGLPLLQFTLLKLWEARERNRVTRAAYERSGGGRLALARSADAVYSSLIPEEQVTARRILLRMVRPGDGLEITSSRLRRATLLQGGEDPGRVERVLQRLVDARLVRLTPGETTEDDQVEVAHEALVRNWPTLVDWLEQEKAAINTRRRLESRAAEWKRLGGGKAGLMDEVESREAERWLWSAEARDVGFHKNVPAFIAASWAATDRAAREQEAARQRELDQAHELAEAQRILAEAKARTAQRLRRATIALIILLVVALMAAGYAFFQQIEARRQRETVDVQRLAFAARLQFDTAAETGLLLAHEAAKREANQITEQTLRDALDRYPWAVQAFKGHISAVISAVFSPDGQRILTASDDNTARVWDLSGKALVTLEGHTERINSAVFSPDGQRILTASDDNTARVWDLNGKELAILQGHADLIRSAVFSPDGQRILTASDDKTARVWDLSGKSLATLEGHTERINSAVFSPDGQRILTASDDNTARVWDLSGKLLATLEGHTDAVWSVVFSPDSQRILTSSLDNTARVWDLSGGPLATLQGHASAVVIAVFSPDGQRILTASDDKTARVWDLSGKLLATLEGHTKRATSAVFSPDGKRILTSSLDNTARLWDLSGKLLATLQGHTSAVISAVFSPDGQRILTASFDNTARLWDLSGRPLATLQGHTSAVIRAVFSPDGQGILTASLDNTARLWDLSGKLLATLEGHTGAVYRAVFSPDGKRILTASDDKTARVWDLSGKLLVTLEGHTERVNSAVFSPDGQRILTASADSTARVWDLSGKLLATLERHAERINSAVFSPDGQRILTASDDKTARVWDLSGKLLATLEGHAERINSAVFSPDGQQILTASLDNTARVWDLSGKLLATLEGHADAVNSAVFSPDGQRILTASDDKTARVWDLSGGPHATLAGHEDVVYSAVFSPDGQRILTASLDNTARVHFVRVEDLLSVAACRVPRGLTREEIQRFDVGTPRFDFATRQCPALVGR